MSLSCCQHCHCVWYVDFLQDTQQHVGVLFHLWILFFPLPPLSSFSAPHVWEIIAQEWDTGKYPENSTCFFSERIKRHHLFLFLCYCDVLLLQTSLYALKWYISIYFISLWCCFTVESVFVLSWGHLAVSFSEEMQFVLCSRLMNKL